jgi:hypothetical protein
MTGLCELWRVVTKVEGGSVAYAEPPDMAAQKGIEAEIVFVRDDGWTLGARLEDAHAAKSLWEGSWVGYVDVATGHYYHL